MALKIHKKAEVSLSSLGDVPVTLVHVDGLTAFQVGIGLLSVMAVRKFIQEANEGLAAIGEPPLTG